MFRYTLFVIFLLLAGCVQSTSSPTTMPSVFTTTARPSPEPTLTATLPPTITLAPPAIPTATETPGPTATRTPLPDRLFGYYRESIGNYQANGERLRDKGIYLHGSERPIWQFPPDAKRVHDLFFSPDGQQLLFTQGDKLPEELYVMGTTGNGQPLLLLRAPEQSPQGYQHYLGDTQWIQGSHELIVEINTVSSSDERPYYTGYNTATLVMLNTDTGKTIRTIPMPENEYGIPRTIFSPDSRKAVLISPSSMSLADLQTGDILQDILTFPFLGYPYSKNVSNEALL